MFNVGNGNNWALNTYRITAKEQVKQLKGFGFHNTAICDARRKDN
jgi:hypothetical protein